MERMKVLAGVFAEMQVGKALYDACMGEAKTQLLALLLKTRASLRMAGLSLVLLTCVRQPQPWCLRLKSLLRLPMQRRLKK